MSTTEVSWTDPTTWRSFPEGVAFGFVVFCGQALLDYLFDFLFLNRTNLIPSSGTPLTSLTKLDISFVLFNRLITCLFTYHFFLFTYKNERFLWSGDVMSLTFSNFVMPYFGFFVIYDFFYHLFHRFLHLRQVYPLIHKHHHRQMAPFRGNVDASNTHPVEYVTGEYLHLFTLFLLTKILQIVDGFENYGKVDGENERRQIHVFSVVAILASMALFASLNHTRFDVRLGIPIIRRAMEYTVIAHDKHHHFITANYSQYTMLWDKIWGTFRDAGKTLDNVYKEK